MLTANNPQRSSAEEMAESILKSISTAIYKYQSFILYAGDRLTTLQILRRKFCTYKSGNSYLLQMTEHPSYCYCILQVSKKYL
jgi:hypothetical protein